MSASGFYIYNYEFYHRFAIPLPLTGRFIEMSLLTLPFTLYPCLGPIFESSIGLKPRAKAGEFGFKVKS